MGQAKHPISNWAQYNHSLVKRGSLTFWIDQEAITTWFNPTHHGRRGRALLYTDHAICTCLMLKGIFKQSLRSTQGLLDSIFELMQVPVCAPDYSCVSRRAQTVEVPYRVPPKGKVTDLVIDSTGLKVFGEGEWKIRKHGKERRRVWRKLHLAVDPATQDIVAAEVSLDTIHDAKVLPTLLKPLRRKLGQIYGDGAYDTRQCHGLIQHKKATACIPPRNNAGLWEDGHPRNEAVTLMREQGQAVWKQTRGYHRRSLAETAMYRYKQLTSGRLSLRVYNAQVGEILANVRAINKLNTLGLPVRQPRN
jgi:hypothetical protein